MESRGGAKKASAFPMRASPPPFKDYPRVPYHSDCTGAMRASRSSRCTSFRHLSPLFSLDTKPPVLRACALFSDRQCQYRLAGEPARTHIGHSLAEKRQDLVHSRRAGSRASHPAHHQRRSAGAKRLGILSRDAHGLRSVGAPVDFSLWRVIYYGTQAHRGLRRLTS